MWFVNVILTNRMFQECTAHHKREFNSKMPDCVYSLLSSTSNEQFESSYLTFSPTLFIFKLSSRLESLRRNKDDSWQSSGYFLTFPLSLYTIITDLTEGRHLPLCFDWNPLWPIISKLGTPRRSRGFLNFCLTLPPSMGPRILYCFLWKYFPRELVRLT